MGNVEELAGVPWFRLEYYKPCSAQATVAKPSGFVPVAIAAPTPLPSASCRDIEVELRRGALTMKVHWPILAAADFAAWAREMLR